MSIVISKSFTLSLEEREKLAESILRYLKTSQADNTTRAYMSDWRHFEHWCQLQGVKSMPSSAGTVGNYLADLARRGYKVSTLQRRISSIAVAHKAAKQVSPTEDAEFLRMWRGLRREHGVAQIGKRALRTDEILRMVELIPINTCRGLRDRALILIGFSGAFRRSELVAINFENLEFTSEGVIIHIERSKTDQEGVGRKIGIPYGRSDRTCPVRALEAWVSSAMITGGALFRKVNKSDWPEEHRLSDKSVATIIKRLVEAIGGNPNQYAGHSLRSGFATSVAAAGVGERDIMRQTGHKSVTTVRRYIQEGNIFKDNAAGRLGL